MKWYERKGEAGWESGSGNREYGRREDDQDEPDGRCRESWEGRADDKGTGRSVILEVGINSIIIMGTIGGVTVMVPAKVGK